jgi:two-component system sensor histidine kinase TctE
MTGKPPYSVRRRLLFWLLTPTVAFGALALLDTWREAIATANSVSDRVLAGSALAIAERVVISESGDLEVDIPYVALEMLTSNAQDRVFYRVDGPSDAFITGYDKLPELDGLKPETTVFGDSTFRDENIRLAALSRSASTGAASISFVVTVAETTIGRQQLARAILVRSAARLALLITGAALIVWIGVSASLRPLERLSREIGTRNPDDLHALTADVPREVSGLVGTLNSFMDRLSVAISGLRNFTGNASHQLRTPMAIVRTQLALANRAKSLDEAKAANRKADEAVVQAERVLAQLLILAHIDAAASRKSQARQPINLAEVASHAVAERILRADAAGIDLGFEGSSPATVSAESLLLGEMVGNLIDNALAYAGKGAEVTVRTTTDGDAAVLEVEDNGPGIPDDKRSQVLRRFARGTDVSPGTGLGLPIVDEIASLFGGKLALENRPAGAGLLARVTFPRS